MARLHALDVQEENLLDLAASAAVPKDKLLSRLGQARGRAGPAQARAGRAGQPAERRSPVIRAALDLLQTPHLLYAQAGERERRLLNQALFERIYVDGDAVTEERLNEPFDELLYFRRTPRVGSERAGSDLNGREAPSRAPLGLNLAPRWVC